MRILDLFSGIGGFALAASWVWDDLEIVSFCEIDPFCQKVLKKHWPDVPCHNDIKTLDTSYYGTIDLVCGGFPCQPVSVAGQQVGTKDNRWLWPEMFRVCRESRPRWLLAENVHGLIAMELDSVLADLESEGYEAGTLVLPACAVDAPHRRDRVWVVGYTGGSGLCGIDRRRTGAQFADGCETLADTDRSRKQQQAGVFGQSGDGAGNRSEIVANTQSQPVGAGFCPDKSTGKWRRRSVDSGSTGNLPNTNDTGRQKQRKSQPAETEYPAVECGCRWSAEPDVGRVAYGIPNRVDRLKSLGNAIVPQVAAEIFKAIKQIEEMNNKD